MKKPEFFIVGAPKSATTSMYYYLKEHRQIYVPARHEMNYFGSDLYLPNRLPSLEAYLSFFREAEVDQIAGEKSVTYLYSKKAPDEIDAFSPGARIIIMLRNPADMLFSLHQQFLFSANEDIVDFEEALAAEDDRRTGNRIPAGAHNPSFLSYTDVAHYRPQVERYLNRFGRDRVLVLLFEELTDRPAEAFRRTLEFLGADPTFRPEFAVHNPAKRVPNIAIRKFMKTHRAMSRALHRVAPELVIDGVRGTLAMTQPQPAPQLDAKVRSRLLRRFAGDIDELGALLARDLSHWYLS